MRVNAIVPLASIERKIYIVFFLFAVCMSLEGRSSLLDKQAPDFELESTAGEKGSLSETLNFAEHHFRPPGPTVVVLFRGFWCSYCAEQLHSYDRLYYDLWRHHNVNFLPISGDSIPTLVEMRDRFDFSFQLLSDPDLEVAETYTGIEDHDHYGEVPIPGTFIVNPDGQIVYEQVASDPSDRAYANYVRHAINNFDGRAPYRDIDYTWNVHDDWGGGEGPEHKRGPNAN